MKEKWLWLPIVLFAILISIIVITSVIKNPNWANIVTTICIFLLGLLATGIYEYLIKPYLFGIRPLPKIEIDIQDRYDCHQTVIELTFPGVTLDGESIGITRHITAYLLRFKISNDGKYFIEDAEVMLVDLKKNNNGQWDRVKGFVPLNLKWSNYDSNNLTMPKIQPEMFKHCDFAYIVSLKEIKEEFSTSTATSPYANNSDVACDLATAVKPFILPTLYPGKYKIKIKFAGNNIKAVTKTRIFSFEDKWTDNESEMFEENITIKKGN